jgi:hypothetical protein
MIPYEIDPSLHPAEREPQLLEDGFSSALRQRSDPAGAERTAPAYRLAHALASKSDF